jgi:DNA replication and repair protein RecF
MIIQHLSLTNFRNYAHLELELSPHITVIQGNNAQGKTNFLESIYFLSTARSYRVSSDRELINFLAFKNNSSPVARVAVEVQKSREKLQLEIALKAFPTTVRKRIRVQGTVCRASELIGQLNVVMFSAQDINLVEGEPASRRRYLDILDSQIDSSYLRALQQYNRTLSQRNNLLRLINENRAKPSELLFWNKELVEAGTLLIIQREHTVKALNNLAQTIHGNLSGGREELKMAYRRSIGEGEIKETFQKALSKVQNREIAQKMSLVGPHRDDLRFLANGMDIGTYGSRGQRRTVALSLRLAEAEFLRAVTKESPVLALDDVLSELDSERCHHLLRQIEKYEQVFITTTDLDYFEHNFLEQVAKFKVSEGTVKGEK